MYLLMSRYFSRAKVAPLPTKLSLALAVLLWVPLAVAQNNLGELLDAGAKKLTPEEFRQELVQRMIVGPTSTGVVIEVMFTTSGMVQGTGTYTLSGTANTLPPSPVNGEWTTDDNGRICTSMRIGGGGTGGMGGGMNLPVRCQFWFKNADQYFFSDSDSDRRAKVLRRTIKQ
jgi:hypothetical protein